ncbi:MAG TPA: tetratricopeptide repeat protein [Pyrinomonadaceae bacterium]|nr:tetratricopeptide repeat protein [Pyrinomonadaceae bacterium]
MRVEGGEGTGGVSPQSPTVPLQDQSRATDGLGDEGEGRVSADTSRVGKAELERILRSQEDAGRNSPAAEATPSRALDPDAHAAVRSPHDTQHNAGHTTAAAHDSEAAVVASSASTRPGTPAPELDEDDLTISVPRRVQPLETRESSAVFGPGAGASSAPSQYTTRVVQGLETVSAPATETHESAPTDEQATGEQPVAQTSAAPSPVARARRSRWPMIVAVCVGVLLFAFVFVWLGVRFLRRPPLTDLSTQAPSAPAVEEAAQQFEAKLAEAESFLAQGNMDEAVARLREANALDPANTRAHRRLGELLLASGARREAIEELRAVTRNAPDDSAAWRGLAAAQFAESLYRDAAESYRRLVELVGEQSADPNDLLAYADALRLSGRAEESRALYERLAASASADVAALARRHLAELAKAQPTPTPTPRPGETADTQTTDEGEVASTVPPPATAQPQPTPAPTAQPTPASPAPPVASTPAEHYRRGVELWSSNRSAALSEFRAAGNPDAHYYLGLSYVEGRDMRSLKRAEIVAALQHFQIAQRGQFAGQARNYAHQLEREFDRLRK